MVNDGGRRDKAGYRRWIVVDMVVMVVVVMMVVNMRAVASEVGLQRLPDSLEVRDIAQTEVAVQNTSFLLLDLHQLDLPRFRFLELHGDDDKAKIHQQKRTSLSRMNRLDRFGWHSMIAFMTVIRPGGLPKVGLLAGSA